MNLDLSKGDRISKGTKTWVVDTVQDGYVLLESGESVELSQIERDVSHDRTQVFHK